MVPELPDVGVEIPEVSQIAVVVEDLDDGMERMSGVLGVGQWEVYRFEPPRLTERTYRGESHDYSMKLGLTYVGDLMVELIEPMEGESIYTEHLDEHGEGLHHVACFAFDDVEAVIERFEDAGMPVIQSGNFDGVGYWYFDTADEMNGVIFETAANLEAMPEPDRTVP
jgi:hypothetical protein